MTNTVEFTNPLFGTIHIDYDLSEETPLDAINRLQKFMAEGLMFNAANTLKPSESIKLRVGEAFKEAHDIYVHANSQGIELESLSFTKKVEGLVTRDITYLVDSKKWQEILAESDHDAEQALDLLLEEHDESIHCRIFDDEVTEVFCVNEVFEN